MKARWIQGIIVVAGLAYATAGAADWPEYRGPDREGVWEADGLVGDFAGLHEGGDGPLPRVWSTPVGAGYSGPTVAGDRVYLMDRGSPDADQEVERIVCVDRATGERLWSHRYPCVYQGVAYAYGPRASVTIHDGKAYALGTMGHLHCLEAETGDVLWERDLGEHYEVDVPTWGMAASPLVEGDIVVVQVCAPEDGACFAGFDRDTGEERWRAFADKGSYVSPRMIEQAGKRVLVAWTGERIAGMDAATGDVHWEIETPPSRMVINVPGPAFDQDESRMFLSVFYDGSRLIELGRDELVARELWHRKGINERKTEALHCMISPPLFHGGYIYGIDSYGQMRCLDPKTGDRIWENLEAVPQGRWGTGFMVKNGDRIWMLTERGDLVIAKLSPQGYEEIDRAPLIEPTTPLKQRTEGTVLWSHPAFAGTRIFARNDRELICVELGRGE